MITLELEMGVYYLKENGKTLMTLHYGYSGHGSLLEKAKRLNLVINPLTWGATKRVTEVHMYPSGEVHIGLDEKKAEEET